MPKQMCLGVRYRGNRSDEIFAARFARGRRSSSSGGFVIHLSLQSIEFEQDGLLDVVLLAQLRVQVALLLSPIVPI